MAIALTTLSVIVQFCAAFFALKLAWKSRRAMLLPLALAILLMAIRRAYSLYGKLAFGRPIDPGAESWHSATRRAPTADNCWRISVPM